MRRVKKACVSSSAIPSWWSTQPSRVRLRLKVRSPMAGESNATRLRRRGHPAAVRRPRVAVLARRIEEGRAHDQRLGLLSRLASETEAYGLTHAGHRRLIIGAARGLGSPAPIRNRRHGRRSADGYFLGGPDAAGAPAMRLARHVA